MSSTVARGVSIIEFVATQPRRLAEVGRHLDVHRSTALRLLQPLVDGGLVRRIPDGRYGIGYRLIGLAKRAQDQFDLFSIAHHALEDLANRHSCIAHLGTRQNDSIVYVDKIEPMHSVRLYSEIGQRIPFHTAGVSKVILAYLPSDHLHSLLEGYDFARHTDSTITSREAFQVVLEEVRAKGWAVDDGEFEDYINCIAAPVYDASGEVIAGVSLTTLKAHTELGALKSLLPDLLATCHEISRELGYRP